MFIEDIGLFGWGWNTLAIVGEDGFVSVGCVRKSIVECLDSAPYLGWVSSEIDFIQGVFPEGSLLLLYVCVYFCVECLDSVESVECWWLFA